eukprot:m.175459 g.175459  ORF g.175459 m.175459 type:complete len:773 (-) comp31821_c1_seq1:377-2695(-)
MSVILTQLSLVCWIFLFTNCPSTCGLTITTNHVNAGPTIQSVSPAWFPVTGGVSAMVTFDSTSNRQHQQIVDGQALPALCRIISLAGLPLSQHFPRGGWKGPSYVTFPATITSPTTLTCSPPPTNVPGQGFLTIALNTTVDPGPSGWSSSLNVSFETLLDAVVGRRPYLNGETEGSLLIESHPSLIGHTVEVNAVLISLPQLNSNDVVTENLNTTYSWNLSIPTLTGTDVVTLPFAALPPSLTADLSITMFTTATPKINVTVRRRFQRLPPLSPSSTAIASALDQTTRGILVGGLPFFGLGWYVAGDAGSMGESNPNVFSGLGVSQIMPYGLVQNVDFMHNTTRVFEYFDAAHKAGVKVLMPMQQFGWTGNPACDPLSHPSGVPAWCNYTARINDPAWTAGVIANVTLVKSHPALLGYYICDDCCPVNDNFENVALQARLYQLIKSVDAYHIVTGAVQCGITWPWTDVPTNPLVPASSVQPQLQLSLDYFLVENYGALAVNHLSDVGVRQGNTHGAICNCNGLWQQGSAATPNGWFDDFPSSPANLQSVMWLGIVTSEMYNNMVFILESGGFESSVVAGGGWEWGIQPMLWGAKARQLLPSFITPFGSQQPNTKISSAIALRPDASTAGITGGLVRARTWVETGCSSICSHIIVVNIDVLTPVQFTLDITNVPQAIAGSDMNVSRIFDASYNVSLTMKSGLRGSPMYSLSDFIGAGQTNIYEVGCHGIRPAKPAGVNVTSTTYVNWKCASRRVLCKHGFIDKDPNNATCIGA